MEATDSKSNTAKFLAQRRKEKRVAASKDGRRDAEVLIFEPKTQPQGTKALESSSKEESEGPTVVIECDDSNVVALPFKVAMRAYALKSMNDLRCQVGDEPLSRFPVPDFSYEVVQRVCEFLMLDTQANPHDFVGGPPSGVLATSTGSGSGSGSGSGKENAFPSVYPDLSEEAAAAELNLYTHVDLSKRVTFHFHISPDSVMETLICAHYLIIPALVDYCVRMLAEYIEEVPSLEGLPVDVIERVYSLLTPDRLLFVENSDHQRELQINTQGFWKAHCARETILPAQMVEPDSLYFTRGTTLPLAPYSLPHPRSLQGEDPAYDWRQLYLHYKLSVKVGNVFYQPESVDEVVKYGAACGRFLRMTVFPNYLFGLLPDWRAYLNEFTSLDFIDLSKHSLSATEAVGLVNWLLEHKHVSRVALRDVESTTRLTTLTGANALIAALADSPHLPPLLELNLDLSSISVEMSRVLGSLLPRWGLQRLSLGQTGASMPDFLAAAHLDSNTSLKALCLSGSFQVTREWLTLRHSAIEHLSFAHSELTETEEVPAPWNLCVGDECFLPRKLVSLDLSACHQRPENMQWTRHLLPSTEPHDGGSTISSSSSSSVTEVGDGGDPACPFLTHLDLSLNSSPGINLAASLDELIRKSRVRVLVLSRTDMTAAQFKTFCTSLARASPYLESLILDRSVTTVPNAYRQLVSACSTAPSIRSLTLSAALLRYMSEDDKTTQALMLEERGIYVEWVASAAWPHLEVVAQREEGEPDVEYGKDPAQMPPPPPPPPGPANNNNNNRNGRQGRRAYNEDEAVNAQRNYY